MRGLNLLEVENNIYCYTDAIQLLNRLLELITISVNLVFSEIYNEETIIIVVSECSL